MAFAEVSGSGEKAIGIRQERIPGGWPLACPKAVQEAGSYQLPTIVPGNQRCYGGNQRKYDK